MGVSHANERGQGKLTERKDRFKLKTRSSDTSQ